MAELKVGSIYCLWRYSARTDTETKMFCLVLNERATDTMWDLLWEDGVLDLNAYRPQAKKYY